MTKDIRLAGWAGIASFVTGAAVVLLTGTPAQPYPSWKWTDQQITDHFAVQQTNVTVQFYLANFGFALVVWLAAGVKRALRTDSRPSVYTSLIVPCALAQAVTLQQTNGMWWVAALRDLPPDRARLAYELSIAVGYTAVHFFMAFMLFATGMAMRRSSAFPRRLTTITPWVAIPVMSGTFFLLDKDGRLAPTTLYSLSAYLTFYAWVLAAGIALVRIPAEGTPES
ncbi:hypothetical protein ACFWXK_11645 [Streptomyces sp. NPDC059070]|uniref:hypothetical protein n=1 Tax=unclassified Streptomyces TaxID=2593676 RepID=UPI0034E2DC91